MRVLFKGQVPKDFDYPEANEDAFEIAADVTMLAISDGASESFDSGVWARLLVEKFVHSPEVNPEWLSEAVQRYEKALDHSTLSWSKLAAFERGSFATFLGVKEFSGRPSVDVLGIGDSLAVFLSGVEMRKSFPYVCPRQFQERPELFSTKSAHNEFVNRPEFALRCRETWDFGEVDRPTLICMTDALGEWALESVRADSHPWESLLSIRTPQQLENFVLRERAERRMRVDDVTLVSVSLGGVASDELPDA